MNLREKEDEVFLKKLGERIAFLRKEKGMAQVELASHCNIEKSNMNRIEAGNTNPTILMLKKICSGLEIEISDLFNGVNDSK